MFAGQVVAFAADGAAQVVITVSEVPAGFGWLSDGPLLVVTRGGRLLRQEAGQVVEVASPLSACSAWPVAAWRAWIWTVRPVSWLKACCFPTARRYPLMAAP
jgi:hypothetical protein